jgi:hypothetical protein
MITTWRDNYNAGASSVLSTQVLEAAISCAIDIQGEALASVSVPPAVPAAITQQEMHNRRSTLAYKILNGDGSAVSQLAQAVAVNVDLYLSASGLQVLKATGDTEPTKAEIKNSISAVWNYFALDCDAA